MIRTLADDWRRHKDSGTRPVFALAVYRFGRWAKALKFWPFRKFFGMVYIVVQPISASIGGVFLHRDTEVGDQLHLIHGGNIQINHATVIGNRVGIMHGVTLGASTDPQSPSIRDDAFIGCNSSILGGVTVGERATVSANSLVISDVPADSLAIGVPAKIVKKGLLSKTAFKPKDAE